MDMVFNKKLFKLLPKKYIIQTFIRKKEVIHLGKLDLL
jgi:hypothetical protein